MMDYSLDTVGVRSWGIRHACKDFGCVVFSEVEIQVGYWILTITHTTRRGRNASYEQNTAGDRPVPDGAGTDN